MPFMRKLRILSGQNLIFLCKQKEVTAFHLFYYQLSPCGRAVSSLLPNNSFSLPETHGLSPTTAVETILLGCIELLTPQIVTSLAKVMYL